MNGYTKKAKHPLPWYTPRFWHGMTMSTWLRELRRNRYSLSPSRLPLGVTITGLAAFNSAFAALSRACNDRNTLGRIEAPLFVLGHWRSGTTFLHELLIRDPRHSFANTYQCFAPHHFELTERWLVPLIRRLLPKRRPMDNMEAGWERPMEDEFALQNLGIPTPYLSVMFPNRGEAYADYLTLKKLSPAQRERWKQALLQFCRRLTQADGRRLVLKSPTHTARIRAVLELFPEAQFIHVSREPQAMFRSTVDLWRTLNSEVGLQVVRNDKWLEQYVIETLQRMYDAYWEDRGLLSSRQLVEIRYEDLVRDPVAVVENAYQALSLGDFSAVEGAITNYLGEVGNYQRNVHREDDGWSQVVDDQWATYARTFGYDGMNRRRRVAA